MKHPSIAPTFFYIIALRKPVLHRVLSITVCPAHTRTIHILFNTVHLIISRDYVRFSRGVSIFKALTISYHVSRVNTSLEEDRHDITKWKKVNTFLKQFHTDKGFRKRSLLSLDMVSCLLFARKFHKTTVEGSQEKGWSDKTSMVQASKCDELRRGSCHGAWLCTSACVLESDVQGSVRIGGRFGSSGLD